VERRAPSCRFGPDRRLTALTGALTLIAFAAAALSDDRPGRILFGGAAVVLLAYTVTDLVFWPRLVASADGLVIRTPALRAQFAWADVASVRADARDRLGLRSVTLEIDAADTLAVFSRRALGADPTTVAGLVNALDPRRR
jgi:hypothetical protein